MGQREQRLNELYHKFLHGNANTDGRNLRLFLEAICNQPSASTSIAKVVASSCGFKAFETAINSDSSLSFLNGPLTDLLQYLQGPELQTMCGGSIVRQVYRTITRTPILWKTFANAAEQQTLNKRALEAFGWFLLQLLSLPKDEALEHVPVAQCASIQRSFLQCDSHDLRSQGQRIIDIVQSLTAGQTAVENRLRSDEPTPGGRHDNDFAEIHRISIYPTSNELKTFDSYLPTVDVVEKMSQEPSGLAVHVDAQFRLLREDMLRDLREDITSSISGQRRRKPLVVNNLRWSGVYCNDRQLFALQLQCPSILPRFQNIKPANRRKFLQENRKFLKHESLACLLVQNDVVTLGTLLRDEDLLLRIPTTICMQVPITDLKETLIRLSNAQDSVQLLPVDTALFAYEPILKQLQETRELSLKEELISWAPGQSIPPPNYRLGDKVARLLQHLDVDHSIELQSHLKLPQSTKLDKAQALCFRAALKQRVAVIQGPPGTGKSLLGSLVAKTICRSSTEKLLIVCYTHHALDDFLESLLRLGIDDSFVVRLGSDQKATARTKRLALYEQRRSHRLTGEQHSLINEATGQATRAGSTMKNAFNALVNSKITKQELLDYLDFLDDDRPFSSAFEVPVDEDGTIRVGKGGKKMTKFYLLDRWLANQDTGSFGPQHHRLYTSVWSLSSAVRIRLRQQWEQAILQDRLGSICESGTLYNDALGRVQAIRLERDLSVMRTKRIIACTTTAAAKYSAALQSISPGVVLVEEAGEILESHVLTALSPTTKHLILIGDHKQLRPKVNYQLSVDKGTGYDLNRSLFERLILKGFPHQALSSQHRMRPEFSALIRELTYPELADADGTKNRPSLRGFSETLIFVNHNEPESELDEGREVGDHTATSTKQNLFEAQMTLKCIRYLGQQGYRTDKMVVLTPYLGQLRLLLDELGRENDPVLNDLDSHDLVRAGLVQAATAHVNKPKLRISTIDNYQGEESDVVVISLTRSNRNNDVGFMSAPERLNVLLSRARDAMILIGNAEHFMSARKGGELWTRFINLLKENNHIFEGFPVRCERHPAHTAILTEPSAFDTHCPDGGCTEACDKTLACGLHKCPQRCHNIQDHSQMKCQVLVKSSCPKGHTIQRRCFQSTFKGCSRCEQDQKKAQKAAERKLKDQEAQQAHLLRMAELEQEIQAIRDEADRKEATRQREAALKQKKKDIETAKAQAARQASPVNTAKDTQPTNSSTPSRQPTQPTQPTQSAAGSAQPEPEKLPEKPSDAQQRWEREKQIEGASNEAIDDLMGYTGLESVKTKLLDLKAKLETQKLQGIDISKERLGMTMLGNAGVGKTSCARIYGRFLSSVGAIAGDEFIETTGSSLANDGVPGLKKMLDDLAKAGGGVFFLDEAYQLASGNSFGGKAVLDFLLAEIEERRGQIAFILAGYQRDMEKFFEHNIGFPSRMPMQLVFADYSDDELLEMMASMVQNKYQGRAKLAGGLRGLYTRILVRRQGRRRGSEGYGNARDLENAWAKVTERQASRIARERHQGKATDVLSFASADIIGPEPSTAIKDSEAWKKLSRLIGLRTVKTAINALVERLQLNYKRELEEKDPINVSLNRLFIGSPGTGKTTVAKLYGSILSDIGLLSKGEMIVKTPGDFVGSVLGESEKNTKAILKATEGKVLVIDEAYGLSPSTGSIGSGSANDPYKTAVIDTIVAEVQSVPGEDRCVLLLGYEDNMKQMLKDANPGLSRRFPIDSAFYFEDFDDTELRHVLELKLNDQGLEATDEAKDVAINVLARARDRPNFGNAGEVENLLSRAKECWQKRYNPNEGTSDVVFRENDFDAEHDRLSTSQVSLDELFSDIVGLDTLQAKLKSWQKMTVNMKARGQDPRKFVPFRFVFKGPPGTGKTTVARRIATFYYNIGILPTKEFSECSAADLIAPYVGQSAPKTREALRSALGKVLFIDEAYRLADGEFGKEAVNEIVDCLTKPDFDGKLVVIIAGYTDDMNSLLRVNQGLASRFPEEVFFESMKPGQCLALLKRLLLKEDLDVPKALDDKKSKGHQQLSQVLTMLSAMPSFGNGRDITTLAKKIASKAIEDADPEIPTISVTMEGIRHALCAMLAEQSARATTKPIPQASPEGRFAQAPLQTAKPTASISTSTSTAASEQVPHSGTAPAVADQQRAISQAPPSTSPRDDGVPDNVWNQLQQDIATEKRREQAMEKVLKRQREAAEEAIRQEEAVQKEISRLEAEAKKKREAEDAKARAEEDAILRRLEQERIRAVMLQRARDEEEARRRALEVAAARRRQQEQQVQKKLQSMGICPAGYRWIQQGDGYRCSAGGHFVSNSALGI